MSINRIGTANMYDSTINNLGSRQSPGGLDGKNHGGACCAPAMTRGRRAASVRARASSARRTSNVCLAPSAM